MFLHLVAHLQPWDCLGSLLGLPRGACHRKWAQICARAPATSPGSAEALPGDAGVVFASWGRIFTAEGALWPPLFVPYHLPGVGGLKGKNHNCGSCEKIVDFPNFLIDPPRPILIPHPLYWSPKLYIDPPASCSISPNPSSSFNSYPMHMNYISSESKKSDLQDGVFYLSFCWLLFTEIVIYHWVTNFH